MILDSQYFKLCCLNPSNISILYTRRRTYPFQTLCQEHVNRDIQFVWLYEFLSNLVNMLYSPDLLFIIFLWHSTFKCNFLLSSKVIMLSSECINLILVSCGNKSMVLHALFWTNCNLFKFWMLVHIYTKSQQSKCGRTKLLYGNRLVFLSK